MRLPTFKKGIHPKGEKHHTDDKAIQVILPRVGSKMVYPMVQSIGVPCQPAVSVDERVLLGQKVGDAEGLISSPIHTSVSGTVDAITKVLTPAGIVSNAVIVENDGLYEEHPTISEPKDYNSYTNDEILQRIREAGIVGLGGAGFPTHVKLSPPKDMIIDKVLINGAECEPYLTTDYRVMLEESEKIVIGTEIILKLLPTAIAIIGIEDNKPKAIEAMQKACEGHNKIKVPTVKTKYPQGSEKQLIWACTGREVEKGKLPASSGVLVINVDTAIAIHRAIVRGRPLMRKVVTFAGGAVRNPGNYKIRLGTPIDEIVEDIGGLHVEPSKIIVGGPMMGISTYKLKIPVMKTTSGILLLTAEEAEIPPERNCIRCGRCVASCPIGLMPYALNQFVIHREIDNFVHNNGMECIECGSCSYVCPSKRHLTQTIKKKRRQLLSQKKKKDD
ncbi:electron transport complex protein RnfC [Anaerotaenia torta]|uniref:electron transport complex subunit RsxC n=1 Tax=Anaerotaenia torta TaxID=433293 RepID=UPI003D25E54C